MSTINKQRHSLWCAVDHDGHVLYILVQRRRDQAAAKKFFRKRLVWWTIRPRLTRLLTCAMRTRQRAIRRFTALSAYMRARPRGFRVGIMGST
jgi:transposase-like protein